MQVRAFRTRQFRAGNSAAVRLPADMAYPDGTDLVVIREGDRIIVEPRKTLVQALDLLQKIGRTHCLARPEFVESERDW